MPRKMPQNLDAEMSVLGTAFIDGNQISKIIEELNVDMFFDERNRFIFNAIKNLHSEKTPLDITTIKNELDKLQPFLMSEGGSVEFVKYEDGIVYVHMGGACSDCGLIDITLKDGIEQIICGEIPEVKEVRRI